MSFGSPNSISTGHRTKMNAIFNSAPMQKLLHLVQKLAPSNAAVLITGETGSGKEVIACTVHEFSLRCSKPFVDVNCAALSDHLMESELFGHEKGAFSGADYQKQGLFELANGGTLLLDEIGELDLRMQVKLLRVLDGAPYYRVGGTRKVDVNVRIIAATNVDLHEAVTQGRFRRDLYHRLDQLRLEVPSLRDRTEDIDPLVRHFLAAEAPQLRVSQAALEALRRYDWPGNVRELRNAVLKASLIAEGEEIEVSDLPEPIQRCAQPRSAAARTLDDLEQRAILEALSETGGKQESAAQMLGISRRTLIRKLKVYGSQAAGRNICMDLAS